MPMKERKPTPAAQQGRRITDEDRAELCTRVDFVGILEEDGIPCKKKGKRYVCALRDERTPSCYVWPPEVGCRASMGWTWKDYGTGQGGDALGYLVDVRGLLYLQALEELARRAGWWPPSLGTRPPDAPGDTNAAGAISQHTPARQRPAGPEPMAMGGQVLAVEAFLAHLLRLVPDACKDGDAYLAARGVLPQGMAGLAYLLPADACRPLAAQLAKDAEHRALYLQAGLLRHPEDGKPQRLNWWGRTCLLPCCLATGRPAYLVGRRLDLVDGKGPKYVNQYGGAGAVRVPYGMPALAAAIGKPADGRPWPKARELLLVEGALDALGAAVLGWPALALLTRLQAHSYQDRHGAAANALNPLLGAMLGFDLVRVVPDNDSGLKGLEGQALATRLVAWLRHAGVRANLATLVDLGLVPEVELGWKGCNVKDLADAASQRQGAVE